MSSGLTDVIVKPCGLTKAEGGQKELVVGHDEKMTVMPNFIARADVASLSVEALSRTGLRFDVCSEVDTPTSDNSKVLDEARSDGDSSSSACNQAGFESCLSLNSKSCCRYCSVSDAAIHM